MLVAPPLPTLAPWGAVLVRWSEYATKNKELQAQKNIARKKKGRSVAALHFLGGRLAYRLTRPCLDGGGEPGLVDPPWQKPRGLFQQNVNRVGDNCG